MFHSPLFSLVTVALFSRNHFTACNLPLKAATISGVQPSQVFNSMFGTCVWIRSVISVSPPSDAKCNEIHLQLFIRNGSTPLSIKLFTTLKAAYISCVPPRVSEVNRNWRRKRGFHLSDVTVPFSCCPCSQKCRQKPYNVKRNEERHQTPRRT